jgi:hypothetical protein
LIGEVFEWVLEKVGEKLAEEAGKKIPEGMYDRIKKENNRQRAYGALIEVLERVAKKRVVQCKSAELSRDCPMVTTIQQYYQPGRTTDGTAPLRIFTIVGSDGQVINIQCFDLTQTIKITVQHKDGADVETLDPREALKRIRREAGYGPPISANDD